MLLFALACAPDPDEPLDTPDESDSASTRTTIPTWNEGIAPLVAEHCSVCHSDGNVAPFALTTYDEAAPMASAIAAAVGERRMPPWPADRECADYESDLSLDDDTIAAFVAWAAAGAPVGEGDPAPADSSVDWGGLPRVDVSLQIPEPYTPVDADDDYRCFVMDWPYAEDVYVTGFRAAPDVVQEVHHVVAFIAPPDLADDYTAFDAADDGPGYDCFGGPGGESLADIGWLGAWAPGGASGAYPAGTGLRMEPGSRVILQLHYHLDAVDPVPDQSAAEFMVETSVEKEALLQPWADPAWLDGTGMEIPAGAEDVTHSFTYPAPLPLTFYTASLHMHRLGESGRLYVERDGVEECLLDIPRWDFNWQRNYAFAEPKQVEAGDAITVECTWDNPGDADVDWGEGTGDEMCLGFLYLTWE